MTGCHVNSARVVVDSRIAQTPEALYCRLRQKGTKQLIFVPSTVCRWPLDAEQWGDFLNRIFAIWVREDIGKLSVQIFDDALEAWCGERVYQGNGSLKCQSCFGRRLCTSANNSLLCDGYLAFYQYSAPFMKVMRDLIRNNHSASELMTLLRQTR